MKKCIFIIGGCRSGKSGHALRLAREISETSRVFIATCVPYDDEMKERVARHQEERGPGWSTIEVPTDLSEAINEQSRSASVILVDCLTLWMSNILSDSDDAEIDEYIGHLIRSLETAECPVILVSNEVGTGIVPENQMARKFRDLAGRMNQRVAACSDMVIWMVAGIPVQIKPV